MRFMDTKMGAVALVACAGSILWTTSARAQLYADQNRSTWHRHHADATTHSRQTMAVEVRLGPYPPNIDDEFGGSARPYRDVFGDSSRWAIGAEVDYQLLRIPYLGTLGPGGGLSYTSMSAKARLTNTGEPSAEDTSLWIMPLYLAAVLRADVFAREFGVPLVPYIKLGVGYGLWKATDGSGTSTYTDGSGKKMDGKGYAYGLHMAPGLMLQLDQFDKHAAQELDTSVGVNHSYAFVEWMWSDLGGAGSSDQLHIGTSTWVTGLAFEL